MGLIRWFRRNFNVLCKKRYMGVYFAKDYQLGILQKGLGYVNLKPMIIGGKYFPAETLILGNVEMRRLGDNFRIELTYNYRGISWNLWPKRMFWGWVRWVKCYYFLGPKQGEPRIIYQSYDFGPVILDLVYKTTAEAGRVIFEGLENRVDNL